MLRADHTTRTNPQASNRTKLALLCLLGCLALTPAAFSADLSITDVSVPEGDSGSTSMVFTVTLSEVAASRVIVDWGSAPGTATVGVDYAGACGTAVIDAGQSSTTFAIDVIGDTEVEPDETILVELCNPVGAMIAIGQATGTISNDDSQPPTVTITAPADASSFTAGTDVSFTGTADDPEDGDLSASIAWSSSLDGALGTGAGVTTSALSVGNHTITASVTDSGGAPGADSVNVIVTQPPPVSIPVENHSFEAIGLADGDFRLRQVPGWVSTGLVGTYDPLASKFVDPIPDGENTAYLNNGNLSQVVSGEKVAAGATYELSVDVGDRADKPLANYAVQMKFGTTLVAEATQADVTPANGEFETVVVSYTALPEHDGQALEIKLVNTGGVIQVNFDNVRLSRIGIPFNESPQVDILGPADGTSYPSAATVDFSGTATDVEDSDISGGLVWSSDIDGGLGTGATLSAQLSNGLHTITATATDSGGKTASDSIVVAVGAGGSLPIANHSFEALTLADGDWALNSIPGWTIIAGTVGTYNPTGSDFPGGVSDGENTAYLNSGRIGQIIAGETVVSGATYTLSVDVGNRATNNFANFAIRLLFGSDTVAEATQADVVPASGEFETVAVSYTALPEHDGRAVEIKLVNTSGTIQVNFDNVRVQREDPS